MILFVCYASTIVAGLIVGAIDFNRKLRSADLIQFRG